MRLTSGIAFAANGLLLLSFALLVVLYAIWPDGGGGGEELFAFIVAFFFLAGVLGVFGLGFGIARRHWWAMAACAIPVLLQVVVAFAFLTAEWQ